ncbi:flagellar biosynthesis protein FliO, partial [Terrihabitans sp. PJ23]|nr:flagellar biosynthesis protein FliO [Terrihabitans sp. PJ23]
APLPPRRPLPERPPVAPRQMAEREAPRPTPAGPDAERAQPQSATKATLDALEEEMASLLGRDRQP